MLLQISQRGRELSYSPIRKLMPLAEAAKLQGIKVYHLNIGQPDLPTPPLALKALRHIDKTILSYTSSQGLLSLREELSRYYSLKNMQWSPEEIIITNGASEAILFAFMACLNPGDEIIMVEPTYANYLSFAKIAGIKVRTVFASMDTGFTLPSISSFEKLINERTKAILICNPNNPTGYLYSQKEMGQLRDLVKKYGLYLISDEVYCDFIYTNQPYISASQLDGIKENVILIDSFSKRYSECGIRVGMLITKNKAVRDTVLKFCQARLCPPLVGQIVAEASLDTPHSYLQAVRDEYDERRLYLVDGLNKIPGVYAPSPMGAFYTMARLPVDDAEKFCSWCLTQFNYKGQTLMMAPGCGFYSIESMGKNEVRLAYVLKKDDLKQSLLLLEKALDEYIKK